MLATLGLALSLAIPCALQEDSKLFEPPTPAEDEFDWIELKSGEWLKGELLRLRDGSLDFDSDVLGILSLDWGDVVFVRSLRKQAILLNEGEALEGTLVVQNGSVRVGGEGALEIPRGELLAIVPGGLNGGGNWSGKISAGLTLRRGNTSTTDYSAYLFARRETAHSRWDSSYSGAFARTSGTETANNHLLSTQYDYYLSKRLYVTPITATAYHDPFSNIDLRLTPAAGFGYELVDKNTISWEIGAGPAYQYTRFESLQPGEDESDSSFAAFGSTRVEWDMSTDASLSFDYKIIAPIPDTDEYNHHLQTVISVDLIGELNLDVTFAWDRINKPSVDEDGVRPEPDDVRLSVGLGMEF